MKKQLLIILLLILQSFVLLLPPVESDWIIDGDTVYIDDENVYLSATPHTIIQDTWVTFKLRSKGYEGDIDACWLFNTTNCKPTKPVYYKVGDGDWQVLQKEFTVETIDFENMTKAYLLKNIDIQKDVDYSLKCFVDIKFNTQGKYWWGVKPSALGWDKGYYIDPWWNSSWGYSKKITIDHTKVDGNLVNFPVLVQNTSNDFKDHARSDGYDFRFLDSTNTTEYHWELENYNSATGNLTGWVNITSLSGSADTVLYCYYGNSGANTNPSSTSTWDSNFSAVYHLNQSSGSCNDSTVNNIDGVFSGTLPNQTSGKIGYGQGFDGTADYIKIADSSAWDTNHSFTIDFWIKLDNYTRVNYLFSHYEGDNDRWFFYDDVTRGRFCLRYGGANEVDMRDEPCITDMDWHRMTVTRSGNDWALLKDNDVVVSDTKDKDDTFSGFLYVGADNTPANFLKGRMDELRFSDCFRTREWRNTIHETIENSSTFMTFGIEEAGTLPQATINATTGIELTNATLRGYISGTGSGEYEYGFWIGTTTPLTEDNADRNMTGVGTVTITGNSDFSHNDTNLSRGIHYYAKAWISNSTYWGSSSNEDDFYTKCNAPSTLTATLDGCNVVVAWTKGTGADKTTVVRKADSYPTSQTDGTVVYNNTDTSYSDTTAAGNHQYYRAWSWAGDKHSDNNASANLLVSPCPPTSVTGSILVNSTLNISWTKGTGASTTLILRKIDSTPSSVTDGTVIYNSTGTYHIATDLTENYYYRLWSYANETYSTSVAFDFGALVINCYDEETNSSLYFDVLVRNESGTQSYESRNNTNPLVINVGENLPLGNDIRIIVSAASNYSDKTETFTGYDGDENTTVTYVILLQVPESKALTNVTCRNTTASTNSYPAFTLVDDVITILGDAADEFSQITVNYTHYEYDSRTYYRDLVGNHVYILNAFLPDADKTELYILQIIDDYDIPVEGVDLEVKRSINGSYEIIASPITDANGKASVYLTPNEDHLVRISKTGYETKNASFIPDPDYYGSYYPITFKITAEDTDITTVTFGDLITFTGEWVTTNNTLRIYFNDKDDNTTDVTFRVYESYGINLTLTNTSAFGSITTVTLYISGLNTSRMHQIRLEMNHTKLGHILNQTIYVSPIRDDDRTSESWLDTIIAIVMGDFDYGYVAFALIYCPCIFLIISLGAVKQPGFGVLCAGLYIILVTWRIDLSNTFMVALSSLLILFGVIMVIVKHGKKLTGKDVT